MNELPLLRENDIKLGVKLGDEALNWDEILKGIPGKIAEAGDGLIIGLLLKQLNSWLSPKIADDVKMAIHDVLDLVDAEEYKGALVELADIVEVLALSSDIDEKYLPWLMTILQLYKGIISAVVK